MNMDRRDFLKTIAWGALAAAIPWSVTPQPPEVAEVSLELFSDILKKHYAPAIQDMFRHSHRTLLAMANQTKGLR